MKRPIQPNFASALRRLRVARDLTQEEFDLVSGRTYVSALERGMKQPTLAKVASLAAVLDVHPLSLLTLSFCGTPSRAEAEHLLRQVSAELSSLDFEGD